MNHKMIILTLAIVCVTYGASAAPTLSFIRANPDGAGFVQEASGAPFVVWGVNYDHDHTGRLLEDYWVAEWPTVVQDFGEIKDLGANVVRVHLQTGRFMTGPDTPDPAALERLGMLVKLAEETGLYLDITGLACYHKPDVPAWYDALDETGRWAVQARFWEAVAGVCAASPAIFCYDLMNEPILPGAEKVETDWLAGEFAGSYFVQRITLDLAGRSQLDVAKAWVDTLVNAIRKQDKRHMITVGVIPWAYVFPGSKPLFYSPEVSGNLDFVSIHLYPGKDDAENALKALKVYAIGKPVVIEEMFPLECTVETLDAFVEGSRGIASGWIGFYWGRTIEELGQPGAGLSEAITKGWLEYFKKKAPEMRRPGG